MATNSSQQEMLIKILQSKSKAINTLYTDITETKKGMLYFNKRIESVED